MLVFTDTWLMLAGAVLGATATLPSLTVRSHYKMQQAASCLAAMAGLERIRQLSCSLTILASPDDFATDLTIHLLHLMVAGQLPYQVQMSPDGGGGAGTAWRSTGCDTYIIVAENLLDFTALLDTDDEAWDWQGRYAMFSRSPVEDLQRLAVMYKLQKTVDVVFIIPDGSESQLAIYAHQLYSNRNLQFLTLWRDGAFVSDVNFFPSKVVNLGGRGVRVVAVNHAPSVFSSADADGRLHNLSGLDVKVVEAVGQALNFQPEFYGPGPDLWGVLLPNGTFTGMVGLVSNDEAEMGIGNVFLTEERARFITFTTPYDFERACFLTPAPRPLPSWMAVSFPFTLHVWILMTASLVLLTVAVRLMSELVVARSPQEIHSTSSAFLIILGQFCNQARPQPTRPPMQVVVGFIMMCGFVVTVFYSSNLTAFMTVKELEQPYTSIRQIVQSGLQVGGYSDFWRAIFRGSANQHVRRLTNKFYRFSDVKQFLRRVFYRKGVLLENMQHLEYLQQTYLTNRAGQSSVRLMLEECINPFGVGVMLKRNSPLKSAIDTTIQRLREGGLVERFFQEVLKKEQSRNLSASFSLAKDSNKTLSDGVQPLTFQHIQGAFLVLGVGLGFALLLLLAEVASACAANEPSTLRQPFKASNAK
ncbi:ionotropic receptor 21a-like [Panulirus ornatus]|uniref:ionotropic receptor 21a-like n=1 Tax=Panulirus ornatus TaxID=150431 RepID=UPI003A870254